MQTLVLQSGLYGDLQISLDFGDFGRDNLPKVLTEYPEKGVLLTSAVESDGGNGFSALESPHVMPTGASQHHHSMRENALFPPPWCFAEESLRQGETRCTSPCSLVAEVVGPWHCLDYACAQAWALRNAHRNGLFGFRIYVFRPGTTRVLPRRGLVSTA